MKHIRATLALGNSRSETVAFPCADSKVKQMLVHRTDDDKYTVYVDELTEPAWMKPIEKTDVNIHELNYLARRMDAMDDNELAKMCAGLSRFGMSDLSQSISNTAKNFRLFLTNGDSYGIIDRYIAGVVNTRTGVLQTASSQLFGKARLCMK